MRLFAIVRIRNRQSKRRRKSFGLTQLAGRWDLGQDRVPDARQPRTLCSDCLAAYCILRTKQHSSAVGSAFEDRKRREPAAERQRKDKVSRYHVERPCGSQVGQTTKQRAWSMEIGLQGYGHGGNHAALVTAVTQGSCNDQLVQLMLWPICNHILADQASGKENEKQESR